MQDASEQHNLIDTLTNAQAVFIADLHLSEDQPELVAAFYTLLDTIVTIKPVSLYILGDWFDAWVGDDWLDHPEAAWLVDMTRALQQVALSGTSIYVCHGNRDFAISQKFLNRFNGKLLPDITYIEHAGKTYHLEHGDRLCTDDKKYQLFRRIIRFPLVLGLLRRLPLEKRKSIAANLRAKSKAANQNKPDYIMDVNLNAVNKALKKADAIIHGHTHRPKAHKIPNGDMRYVLGDWRNKGNRVEAMIGVMDNVGFSLIPLEIWASKRVNFQLKVSGFVSAEVSSTVHKTLLYSGWKKSRFDDMRMITLQRLPAAKKHEHA